MFNLTLFRIPSVFPTFSFLSLLPFSILFNLFYSCKAATATVDNNQKSFKVIFLFIQSSEFKESFPTLFSHDKQFLPGARGFSNATCSKVGQVLGSRTATREQLLNYTIFMDTGDERLSTIGFGNAIKCHMRGWMSIYMQEGTPWLRSTSSSFSITDALQYHPCTGVGIYRCFSKQTINRDFIRSYLWLYRNPSEQSFFWTLSECKFSSQVYVRQDFTRVYFPSSNWRLLSTGLQSLATAILETGLRGLSSAIARYMVYNESQARFFEQSKSSEGVSSL